jgi:peptide-methionine (S)-S-oxide reductase
LQKQEAIAFIKQLTEARVYSNPIVTEVTVLDVFYVTDEEHYDYYNNNKQQPYCQFIITPKIDKIKQYFKDKLKEE